MARLKIPGHRSSLFLVPKRIVGAHVYRQYAQSIPARQTQAGRDSRQQAARREREGGRRRGGLLRWHAVPHPAQQGLAPDCQQRPLRSRCRQQVKPGVRSGAAGIRGLVGSAGGPVAWERRGALGAGGPPCPLAAGRASQMPRGCAVAGVLPGWRVSGQAAGPLAHRPSPARAPDAGAWGLVVGAGVGGPGAGEARR